jgi:uncharacterized membrane protein YgcG
MKFNFNFDLGQFVKTKVAQQIQQSQIGNFVKQKGAPAIISTILKQILGEKPKAHEGVDMGQQVEPGVIPVVYGHVGMSNTQFDLGQKPSDIDPEFVTQEVRMPISEGSIIGVAKRLNDNEVSFFTGDNTEHLKQVVINDSFVIDPSTNVANFKDIKFEITKGDGTSTKQTATITDYNPLLVELVDDVKIEALDDPTNTKLLNDLGDVQAGKGENYVLYWNNDAGRWEAKSFNSLLNETGATYDGGAGGTGGDGGDGGTGGGGGTGGVGPATGGIKYTQWNPPPVHVETEGTLKTTTTITEPPATGTTVVSGKGAPLRREDQSTPYFSTDIDFAEVDEAVDEINVTTFFPDGIYKEIKTVATTVDGTITRCGTTRPIANSGNLDCDDLTPAVTVAPDGKTSTTQTREAGEVRVYVVLTTTLCSREFVLHEFGYTVNARKIGGYKHTKSFKLSEMNAGSGAIVTGPNAGTQQIGALDGSEGDCNATDLQKFKFSNFTLQDYLDRYPDQIVKAANQVKVYAWIDNKFDGEDEDEFSISTNTFLHAVDVCKPIDDFEKKYSIGNTTQTDYQLFKPDHGFQNYIAEPDTDPYELNKARCYSEVISGSFSTVAPPQPLIVDDGTVAGASGDAGSSGSSGSSGSAGTAGTQGSVTVPSTPDVPFAEMSKDSSYSGDGVADTVTLPKVTVTNADASASNTLVISVEKGTVDVTTVQGSVSASNRNSASMTLIGTAANLQTCLDSGLKFSSTTATTGDVTITFAISSSEGASETTREIRSQAITDYEAPSFTITVTGTSGKFKCLVRGKLIMNTITASGTTSEIAEQIKVAINDYTTGVPDFTATRSNNVVTVTGPVGLGNTYNGIQPTNGALSPLLTTSISQIAGGVSPSRITQPKQTTKTLKAKFIPALAFTNPLTASDVSFAQVKYRPAQGDGETDLSELGFFIGGRDQIEEPTNIGVSFSAWKSAGYSSTKGWSNNPAWVFFDYLTNTTFGLGNDIILDSEQKEQLYADIYNASLWCKQNPTGNALQNAARFNGLFYGAESKFEALQKIADSMFAKFLYLNGNPRLFYDGQSFAFGSYTPTIKKLVNQTNSAEIIYQGGSVDNIFNVINVKWNNPDNYFRLEDVQYRNATSIAKFGERETTIELTGCTSKQQALWHGAWMFETEQANSETVTYIAGFDHYDVIPGDLILLNDTLRVDTQTTGGRVSSVSGDTLTLDRNAGSGSIAVMDQSGVMRTGTVSGTTATMSGSHGYLEGAVFNTYSGTLYGNYRVVAIEESEDGIYAVTAHKHDPDKYTRIWANTV